MSGIDIVGALVLASAEVTGTVPEDRIKAGQLPEGVILPALLLTRVSRTEQQYLTGQPTRLVTERIQVTARCGFYAQVDTILGAVRRACGDQTGTIAGFDNVAVLLAGTGPDFMDEQASIYMGSTDLRVSFTEVA